MGKALLIYVSAYNVEKEKEQKGIIPEYTTDILGIFVILFIPDSN